jgi:hypothetical protein
MVVIAETSNKLIRIRGFRVNYLAHAHSKGVNDLERLASALFVTREMGGAADVVQRAKRLTELKPHVSPADAASSVEELDRIAAEAGSLTRV